MPETFNSRASISIRQSAGPDHRTDLSQETSRENRAQDPQGEGAFARPAKIPTKNPQAIQFLATLRWIRTFNQSVAIPVTTGKSQANRGSSR